MKQIVIMATLALAGFSVPAAASAQSLLQQPLPDQQPAARQSDQPAATNNVHPADPALFRPLSAVTLANATAVSATDDDDLILPKNEAAGLFEAYGRIYDSAAPDFIVRRPQRNTYPICHQPLYFEDPNLERCGITHGCATELVSATRFFGRVPVLPYLLTANCPDKCVRALPDCPTCHRFGMSAYLPRWDWEAAEIEYASVVGLIFLIP